MKKIIVPEKYNNKSLSKFLLEKYNGLSMNTLYKALRKKDIRINNVKISENCDVHTNDEITIYIVDELLFSKNFDIQTIYEDENILVVNKPRNITITDSSLNEETLTSILNKKYPYIEPCHRLDRNTAGLVVYAKNNESLNILFNKFKNKEINKKYICRVYGILENKSQVLTSYLFKDTKKSKVYISDTPKQGYQKIVTKYKVLKENFDNNTSILDIELITGRTHQIRAHLSHIGHPIIGDGKYGKNEINKKFNSYNQELCSYKLEFNFKTDSGILNYLNNKTFTLNIELNNI